MSSPRPSDGPPPGPLDRLEDDIPTSVEDSQRLRELRQRRRQVPLERMNELAAPEWMPRPRRRPFGEDWEAFELGAADNGEPQREEGGVARDA